jgi:hypothetical protein
MSLLLEIPGWAGHTGGQHTDVRLRAEGGEQAQGSYPMPRHSLPWF